MVTGLSNSRSLRVTLTTVTLLSLLNGAWSNQVYVVHLKGQALPAAARHEPQLLHHESAREAFRSRALEEHRRVLGQVGLSSTRKVYSYTDVLNGFAAKLSEAEAAALQAMPGVLSVRPDGTLRPSTTDTPAFLGLRDGAAADPPGLWSQKSGQGVVVGVIDTGIWPEGDSFNPAGLPAAPAKFNGTCQIGTQWTSANCNNKIIGARYFSSGYIAQYGGAPAFDFHSARDAVGHGSHTASTAAGAPVGSATIGSVDFGGPAGMAYNAHISVYKVCWTRSLGGFLDTVCKDSDVYSGFDAAIRDRVDVISCSLATDLPASSPLDSTIDRGALLAALAGIAVATGAGNRGPSLRSALNLAPWYLTVAATNVPRSVVSTPLGQQYQGEVERTAHKRVHLGSGASHVGYAMSEGVGSAGSQLRLVYGGDAPAPGFSSQQAGECEMGSLDDALVGGALVLCDKVSTAIPLDQGYNVFLAQGAGMILRDTEDNTYPTLDFHYLPAIHVDRPTGIAIRNYMQSTSNPSGYIGDVVITKGGALEAPVVAGFSGRGPHPHRDIMKPDIAAPGVNILAAWTQAPAAPGHYVAQDLSTFGDERTTQWGILSGTSMACPHVSGVMALLRALHPSWTPTMLYSALTTTALKTNNAGDPIASAGGSSFYDYDYNPSVPLAPDATTHDHGSGYLNPNSAANPGLVYEADTSDYMLYLCSYPTNETTDFVQSTLGESCPLTVNVYDYNSPSLMMTGVRGSGATTTRWVRNVGPANSVYTVRIEQPRGAQVTIHPSTLRFPAPDAVLSFTIHVVGTSVTVDSATGNYVFGEWVWESSDGQYSVASPLVINIAAIPSPPPPPSPLPPPPFPPPPRPPPPAAAGCGESGVPGYLLLKGVDLYGSDTGSSDAGQSVADCRTRCEAEASCLAFVFVKAKSKCWFKYTIPHRRANPAVDSYVACIPSASPPAPPGTALPPPPPAGTKCNGVIAGYVYQNATDHPHQDYAISQSGARLGDCAANCSSTPGCTGFTVDLTKARCWFKAHIVKPRRTKVADSYVVCNPQTPPVTPPEACGAHLPGYYRQQDTDRRFFDFKISKPRTKPSDCAATCSQLPHCTGFVLRVLDSRCWFKGGLGKTTFRKGVDAFVKCGAT